MGHECRRYFRAARILLFGQSMGTAVSIAAVHALASQPVPIVLAGTTLVAPFLDVAMVSTYRIAGIIPTKPVSAVLVTISLSAAIYTG